MKRRNKQSGMSIIEILIVTTIIVILSTAVLINWKTGEKKLALQRASHQVSQDIRQAQEAAMNFKSLIGPTGEDVLPIGGYGVYFDVSNPLQYVYFADCDGDKQFTDTGTPCGTVPNQFAEVISTISLEPGIGIDSISASPLHITFRAPDPTTYLCCPTSTSAFVTIINEDLSTIIITVNQAGLIAAE